MRLCRRTRARDGERGFTLFEALVALAILAAGLAAIGRLGFATVAAAHRAQTRLFLAAAARKAFAALSDAPVAPEGERRGEIDGALWRYRATPFAFAVPGAPAAPFVPLAVELVVSAPDGGQLVVHTVTLQPTAAR